MFICNFTRKVFNYVSVYDVTLLTPSVENVTVEVRACKCLRSHSTQNLDVLSTFDMRHQNHVIPYPVCDRPIQVWTLHYILLSSLEIFSVLQYLVRVYALPPDHPRLSLGSKPSKFSFWFRYMVHYYMVSQISRANNQIQHANWPKMGPITCHTRPGSYWTNFLLTQSRSVLLYWPITEAI